MLGIVKRNEQETRDWLADELGFLAGVGQYDGLPIHFDAYQIAFLRNRRKYRWIVKARQVGFSFLFACEALARCHLRQSYTSVFVSYNLDDAKEKINYARQLHEELPLCYQKRVVTDSKTELGFQSNGQSKRVSRIISNPSKAPRGKRGDIYLDELAHYANDREVYKGSTALIVRSQGQFTGCSSPLGRRGIFWEIAEEELRPYPTYTRQRVPWWLCRFFSTDAWLASRRAHAMTTAERVKRFGTTDIQNQYNALLLEDFGQEFELDFCDETYSFFPYDLILPNTRDELTMYEEFIDFPSKLSGRLTAGFDVGRKRDTSELVILEEIKGHYYLRFARSYDRVPFATQEADLVHMMETLPIARLSIDNTGIGMHLAENLANKFPTYVRQEPFTSANKELWCNDIKILLQQRRISLPKDRDLVGQIHSIKRRVTPAGKIVFDVEKSGQDRHQRGHADRFWALALACQKERFMNETTYNVHVRIIG